MILEKEVFNEIFKITNIPGSARKFIRHIAFIRDPRTGLYGLAIFKNDEYQVWSISNYGENSLNASLNRSKTVFTSALSDIQHIGRDNDISIIATTALSKIHHFQFDDNEEFTSTAINIANDVIFTRQLPNRSTLIAVTIDGKLAKYSIEGHLQTLIEIPNASLPKSFAISQSGKNAAVGDKSGKLFIFDLETMELQHTIDVQSGLINAIEFASENQILLASKQTIQLYTYEEDLGAGTWAYSRTFLHHTDVVTSIAVFNEHFATSGYDLSVCIWNINADDEPVHVIRLKNEYATSINWSPDGNYLAIATDEASVRIFRTPFTAEVDLVDEREIQASFWDLVGNSIFDPLALRKTFGWFNPEAETLIFLKMQVDPSLKLHDAHEKVDELNHRLIEEQNNVIRQLRKSRRRQRKVIAFQSRVEQMRLAALREGREFVPPTTPPFSEPEDENLDELSDIEALFEREEPPVEELKAEFPDPFASPLSSPARSNAGEQKSGSEAEENVMPVDFSMLSDSDEDENKADSQESQHEVNEEPKSPVSEANDNQQPPTIDAIESPNPDQLWASDDEEEEEKRVSKSNENVEMDDLSANNNQQQIRSPPNEEEHNSPTSSKKQPSSNASAASSPLASPPIESP